MYIKTLLINIGILILSVGALLFLYKSTYGTLLTGSLNDVISGKQSFISFGSKNSSSTGDLAMSSTSAATSEQNLVDDSSFFADDGSINDVNNDSDIQVVVLDDTSSESAIEDTTIFDTTTEQDTTVFDNTTEDTPISADSIIETVIAESAIGEDVTATAGAEKFDRGDTTPTQSTQPEPVIAQQPEQGTEQQALPAGPSISCNGFTASLILANTPKERRTGLMFRESIQENQGMFFTFDTTDKHGIWMKNMEFPIDIIWLDEQMSIVDIQTVPVCDLSEATCPIYEPATNAKYVLEVNAGISDAYGIVAGDSCTQQG